MNFSLLEKNYNGSDKITVKMGQITLNSGPAAGTDENPYRQLAFSLQKLWIECSKAREDIRAEQHRLVLGRAKPVWTESTQMCRDADKEKLFKKLVTLCIVLSGLGSPSSDAVVKETYPALHSVVKVADVGRLVELEGSERQQHLMELSQIVMGIRLFNKDCRKGGEGIDDLPELLTRAVDSSKSQFESVMENTRGRCERLTSVLYSLYRLNDSCTEYHLPLNLPPGFTRLDAEMVKSALVLCWQLIFCLKELRSELLASELHLGTCVGQLRETLVQLHETVRYRAAIPTVQVYPLFVQLSLIWRELQYEAAVLSHFSRMLRSLSSIANESSELSMERSLPSLFRAPCTFPRPDYNSSGDLQLRGFCPWTVVQSDGGLTMGSYVEDNLAFRSQDAAQTWTKNQGHFYNLLRKVLASRPELIHFLKIQPDAITPYSESVESENVVVETAEVGVQTEVHPVESYIDRDWTWSEWELKRRAVQLARLTRCATKSQQTHESGFRVSKSVQCVYKKTRAT